MNDALQRLIDKDEIRDLMARYARSVDGPTGKPCAPPIIPMRSTTTAITKAASMASSSSQKCGPAARRRSCTSSALA